MVSGLDRETGGLGEFDAVEHRCALAPVPGQRDHLQARIGFGHRALFDGCDKMEMIEGVARVQLLASLKRPPTPLSAEERRTLDAQRDANLKRVKSPPRPWERDR